MHVLVLRDARLLLFHGLLRGIGRLDEETAVERTALAAGAPGKGKVGRGEVGGPAKTIPCKRKSSGGRRQQMPRRVQSSKSEQGHAINRFARFSPRLLVEAARRDCV